LDTRSVDWLAQCALRPLKSAALPAWQPLPAHGVRIGATPAAVMSALRTSQAAILARS